MSQQGVVTANNKTYSSSFQKNVHTHLNNLDLRRGVLLVKTTVYNFHYPIHSLFLLLFIVCTYAMNGTIRYKFLNRNLKGRRYILLTRNTSRAGCTTFGDLVLQAQKQVSRIELKKESQGSLHIIASLILCIKLKTVLKKKGILCRHCSFL